MTVAHTAHAAADRATSLAEVIRSRTAGHPAAVVLLAIAAHLDAAALSFTTDDAPVIGGTLTVNTIPAGAGLALMECRGLADDHPEAELPEELFAYVTAPVTRRTVALPPAAWSREGESLRTRIRLAAHELDALSAGDSVSRHAFLAILWALHRDYAVLADQTTADPNGNRHTTSAPCAATWRREPINRLRPELGTTTQFGHRACGAPGRVDRFVKAARANYYIPVYACPEHRG